MIRSDCHMHTEFSTDSEAPVRAMADAALAKGLTEICITDHYDKDYPPVPDVEGTAFLFEPEEYFQTLSEVRNEYAGRIDVRTGIEIGLQPHLGEFYRDFIRKHPFDFVIGSTHTPRGKKDPYFTDFSQVENPYLVLDAYFAEELELAREADFDTLAHLTYPLRYIVGDYGIPIDVSRYAGAIDEIFRTLVRREKALEVNTSGLRQKIGCLLPERDMLLRYRELGGRLVTLGSDAHKSADVGKGLEEGGAALRECGFTHYAVYRQRRPTLYPLAGASSL